MGSIAYMRLPLTTQGHWCPYILILWWKTGCRVISKKHNKYCILVARIFLCYWPLVTIRDTHMSRSFSQERGKCYTKNSNDTVTFQAFLSQNKRCNNFSMFCPLMGVKGLKRVSICLRVIQEVFRVTRGFQRVSASARAI